MEYVVVGLLVLVLIFLVILIMRKKDDSQMIERLGRFETDITKEVGSFKLDFSKDLRNDFEKLKEKNFDLLLDCFTDEYLNQLF